MLAFDYDGEFDWIDRRIAGIQELTYEEFVEHAKGFLGKENQSRLALFVNGELPNKGRISYKEVASEEEMRQDISYKPRKESANL